MPHHVPCAICDVDDTRDYQETGVESKVVQCRRCGFIYVNPQPDVEDMHYEQQYYQDWEEKQMKRRKAMWQRRLERIRKKKPNGTLLDVGCGLGTFLRLADDAGYTVCGTEVSNYTAGKIQKETGLTVYQGALPELTFPETHFDIITFWHSLEHVDYPLRYLQKARSIIQSDGLLVIAVPNVENRLMRVLYRVVRGRPLSLYEPNEKEVHLSHFSEKTLELLLRKAGFSVIQKGIDYAQVMPGKIMIEQCAKAVHRLTGINYAEALILFAVSENS